MQPPTGLMPRPEIMKRIMVYVQPGMEVIICASPLITASDSFVGPSIILGRLSMNAKRSLWFTGPNGVAQHLAKSPDVKPKKEPKRK